MKQNNTVFATAKSIYTEPTLETINFSALDIISTSGDENEGEWDPQMINL